MAWKQSLAVLIALGCSLLLKDLVIPHELVLAWWDTWRAAR